ncbi:hypothetical protein JM79_2774 [Gramella sp. Hel_I_59]|uniref:hypothetical protein n=1 Tax=Gramella sp. Hel_I_59 TaxID=1249978 RepID=UPI0011507D6C|nr:hypothetical protein [Gramella sp. Hel_I_59]TQI71825.1 hypothetical protein JM79_2774 [Gramella sp. Hel_I_59]
MGATKIFNLAIKVNDKEAKTTLNSVGKELKAQRSYVRNLEEGTAKWNAENKKLAQLEGTYDKMKKNQREFINQTKEAANETGNSKKAIQDFGQAFGQVTQGIMSGDLVMVQEGLRGMRTGIIAATKASIAFIATPLGATLAAIALAVGAVTQYFRDSEEGQNAWNKVTAVTSAVVGNFTDLISDLGRILIKVFSDPKKTLIELKDSIIQNVENRVTGLIKFFPRLGEAIDLALSGKFKEAGKVATDAVAQIATGVEDFSDKAVNSFGNAVDGVKKFGNEIASEAKRQAELADLAAEADKIERQLIIDKGKVEAQVAEARRKARDEENLSSAERGRLLTEAKEAQDELYDREIKAAEIRRQIKAEENTFSKSTKEDLTEEAELTAKVDQVRRQKADAGRNLMRDELRIKNELGKASQAAEKADEQRLQKLNQLEEEYLKKAEDRLADSDVKKAELEQKRAVEKAQALGASLELQETIRKEHQVKVDEAKAAEEEAELQRRRDFEAKKLELENELELARAETEAEKEEIKREQAIEKEEAAYQKKLEEFQKEIEFLNLTENEKNQVIQNLKESHENVLLGIQKKATDEKIADERRLAQEKKKLLNDSLDAAINLAGQETKVGQALLLAKQFFALKETAIQLGLFQNKMALNTAEAAGNIAAGTAETAKVGFPQNIPLLLGFAAQVGGIIGAIKNATKAKSKVKTSFARGGFTDPFGMGYKDETGHEVAGDVHVGEYVVPKIVRQDPEVPPILNYLEKKRKKALNLYADGGDTVDTMTPPSGSQSGDVPTSGRAIELLEDILEATLMANNILFGYEAELERQKMEEKLKKIKDRSKIKS